MKRLLVVLMLLCPVAVMGQTKAVKDFPLTVHVLGSRWLILPVVIGGGASDVMQINVHISGKRYLLIAAPKRHEGLLKVGDYKARLILDKQNPPYEIAQIYLLRFADGKTQKFYLEAIGEW